MSADATFASAARALLDRPLLDRDDPAWVDVVTSRSELSAFFDDVCGWTLHVEARAGLARLHKRTEADPTRPLLRRNDSGRAETAMRASGYAILMAAAAELVTRPTTTIGDLADHLTIGGRTDPDLPAFDPAVAAHRRALVDAIEWFAAHRLLTVTAGSLDQYRDAGADAVIVADPARFSRLLSTTVPPSRLPDTTTDWIGELSVEPRYRTVFDGTADLDTQNRHARHVLGRRLLDDPAVILDELDDHVVRYLATPTGRRVLRAAVERVGFVFEENADCLVAVDMTGEASDRSFGRSTEIITQVAVAVLELLCPNRDVTTLAHADVEAFVAELLAGDERWAAAYQKPGGAGALTERALEVLEGFRLVAIGGEGATGTVTATVAAGRFVTTVVDSRHSADDPITSGEHERLL